MCGANAESFYRECYLSDRVDITDADVILIMLGTNRGLSGDYEIYYRNIISAIKADMKDGAAIILVAPPSATKDASKAHYGWHPNVIDATNKVKELSESLGLPMINAYAMSPIQPHTEYKYQPIDGLHLSEDGYRAFAKFMAKEITRLLELEKKY
jgi:lysophospholipase L1-like esterase